MESRSKNINSFWGYLLIEELARNNITSFIISPGSRSTPLTIAAAENKKTDKIISIDERTAAFHALGYARATGNPAVVICTSGTAAANLFPAIVEAKKSQIPLILLTADRPPELRDTGANQTIDQVKMYGNYLNWQFDLPCPDIQIPAKFVLSTIDQVIHKAKNNPPGPVHLNCMFREPLEPGQQDLPKEYINFVSKWEKSGNPYTKYYPVSTHMNDADLKNVAEFINSANKGLIVIGKLRNRSEQEAVSEFVNHLNWPVFADITSGVRKDISENQLVTYFDQLLLSESTINSINPDIILHFGQPLTSKRYLNTIEKQSPQTYIQFHSGDERLDPAHLVTQRISGDLSSVCRQLIQHVVPKFDQSINEKFKNQTSHIISILEEQCLPDNKISEISIASMISKNLPENQGLFLASSMPIRDFDMYAGANIRTGDISANRGASGIDGTLATALGFARGLEKRVTVVMGDLALLHDLNSLSLIRNSRHPITIVLINNRGGGIFSFLPVAEFDHVFEKYFATPHQYKFNYGADMFDLNYECPVTNKDFVNAYIKSTTTNKSTIIEISTEREENYKLHQEIQQKILNILEK
jgi:2-succinyl-5-enolpyruvyl-6-hydroxy-3-cyclohexene-1-carboxylate synthase